jgi:LPS-assembly protein
MLFAPIHPYLRAQELTTQAPRPASPGDLPDAPAGLEPKHYPVARIVSAKADASDVNIVADTQSTKGNHVVLDGNVVITYGDRTLDADHVEYDRDTADVDATGHVVASGGENTEHIEASHGILNIKTQTGRFYDVTGSVGIKSTPSKKLVYTNGNPFLFTGRVVVKTGPRSYDIYDGTVTSCELPDPHWLLSAKHFKVDDDIAKAHDSVFHIIGVPFLYLPYVTHAVDTESRQSGFYIPVISDSSTKGLVIGEQIYFAINRSTDFTIGAEYYSMRGWSQLGTFRYRGPGDDFLKAHYSGLLDRLVGAANQGGEDFIISGRHDLDPATRLVVNAEYLSSFTYRAAFSDNFNQAVSTDVLSTLYSDHQHNGLDLSVYADRYQGLKTIPITAADGTVTPGEQVRIFHAPSIDFTSVDRQLGHTGLVWDTDASAAGLKRVQPHFQTSGIVERYDFHSTLAYPIEADGWDLRPSIGVRETFYSRSKLSAPGNPIESTSGLNRADAEVQVDARAPVVERTFTSGFLQRLLRTDFEHTIEPAVSYRYVAGVDNFQNILRFDDHDIVSDTNEVEYGATQRLFLRPRVPKVPCAVVPQEIPNPLLGELPTGVTEGSGEGVHPRPRCGTREWITWKLTQKYFFDPTFGGAIQTGRRNIFDTTLDLSGIAFLTEPRNISPLISCLRVRASEKIDIEWNWDYDTGAKKFTADNVFVDVHEGPAFAGFSYARLNAPGRAYSEGVSSSTSNFTQVRVLLGYGEPTRRGLSMAANAGVDLISNDLQYATLQTTYNWDCCGVSVEYRKYELGSIRNESVYRFNITLANIGTAGNLKRAEQLF